MNGNIFKSLYDDKERHMTAVLPPPCQHRGSLPEQLRQPDITFRQFRRLLKMFVWFAGLWHPVSECYGCRLEILLTYTDTFFTQHSLFEVCQWLFMCNVTYRIHLFFRSVCIFMTMVTAHLRKMTSSITSTLVFRSGMFSSSAVSLIKSFAGISQWKKKFTSSC